jgi:hypothetical protein
MAAGRKVFPALLALLAAIALIWLCVQLTAPGDASLYTTAIFLPAFVATALVIVLLGNSSDLSDLANFQRRLKNDHAVVAFVLDTKGRILLHFQPDSRATSWQLHWVPPGGLVESGVMGDSPQERLNLLVDNKHQWGDSFHLAATNDSRAYRRMNDREEQVAVQIEAYWVWWSDDEPLAPESVFDGFNQRSLRPGSQESMPQPVPPYYPELFSYLDAVCRGEDNLPHLKCWTVPKIDRIKAAMNGNH